MYAQGLAQLKTQKRRGKYVVVLKLFWSSLRSNKDILNLHEISEKLTTWVSKRCKRNNLNMY